MTEIKDFPAECLIVSAGVFLSGRAGPDKYLLGPSYDLLDLVSLMTHQTTVYIEILKFIVTQSQKKNCHMTCYES